jgi:hypothetical protein
MVIVGQLMRRKLIMAVPLFLEAAVSVLLMLRPVLEL